MEWKRGPCQTYTTEPVSCYPATFQLNPLPDSLTILLAPGEGAYAAACSLAWGWKVDVDGTDSHLQGANLNLCNSKLQWIGGFQQSNEIWEMVFLPFYQSYWFVTAGSFRIIQVKCISKSSWKKCLNPLKNAFDFQVPNSGRDTPYLLSAVLWLEGCVIFVPMETHDDPDSDLCSFWFLAGWRKNTSNKWTTKQVVEIGDFNFSWHQWVKLY